jgi:hypothetical protein
VAGLAVAGLVLGACADNPRGPNPERAFSPSLSQSSSSSATGASRIPTSPSLVPSVRGKKPSRPEILAAVKTLRRYLEAWVTEGSSRASRYLVASQRTGSDQGSPHLEAGAVTSYRLDSWAGPGRFTLLVSMELRFIGDAQGWNRGINDRFVTAHRLGNHRGYRLELATSP